MNNVSLAVVKSDFHDHHSTSWGKEWIRACEEHGVDFELVDWRSFDAFEIMRRHGIVLWHFSHYSRGEMEFARPILSALEACGCRVFPGPAESAHFDDKVSQAYLLRALGIPSPRNYPLHSLSSVETWIRDYGAFPIVAKLKSGSGSNNVVLIRSARQLRRYAERMFGSGISSRPSLAYKMRSNVASSRSITMLISRARRAPEFLFSLRNAKELARERGYVYLQEFVPGLTHDLKIVVVGDKLGYIGRQVRGGDFRASGSGGLHYDVGLVNKKVIDVAFDAADKLNTVCMGFDIVVNHEGEPLILELSYGFSHLAVLNAQGHFDRDGVWHESPLNAPREIVSYLVREASSA